MKRAARLEAASLVVLLTGLYGLWVCAPGFRPKELGDFFWYSLTQKGLGIVLYALVFAALVPAAARLRRLGFVRTHLAGLFATLAPLLTVDFVFDTWLKLYELSPWAVRAAYLAIVAWGWADWRETRRLGERLWALPARLWQGLDGPWWKLFAVLVAFFLWRQELHFFFTRPTPYGDETFFWYTASERLLKEGLHACIEHHNYMPGLPWLASFPSRLLGSVNTDWLYAYIFMIMSFYAALLLELAETAFGGLAGTTVLFFVFLLSRDLLDLFGAKFYGEALAALLTAGVMAEVYLTWVRRPAGATLARVSTGARAVGLGLFVGYCSLARPGISELARGAAAGVAVLYLVVHRKTPAKLWQPAALLALALVNVKLWKLALAAIDRPPEYANLTLLGFIQSPADWSIPAEMIRGLFNKNQPQAAYTWGLIATAALVLLRRAWRLAAVMGTTIVLYWGFTFIMYATLWQHVERGSAGRYLAHAAVGCVLLVPLLFPKRAAA